MNIPHSPYVVTIKDGNDKIQAGTFYAVSIWHAIDKAYTKLSSKYADRDKYKAKPAICK